MKLFDGCSIVTVCWSSSTDSMQDASTRASRTLAILSRGFKKMRDEDPDFFDDPFREYKKMTPRIVTPSAPSGSSSAPEPSDSANSGKH